MKRHALSLAFTLALAATALAQTSTPTGITAPGRLSQDQSGFHLMGQTQPSAMVSVPAMIRGKLASVSVREGQSVKKDQELAHIDDALQKQEVELARVKAESMTQIRAAQNQLEFDKNQYDKVKNNQVTTETERKEKQLKMQQSELTLDLANEGKKEAQVKYEQERIKLEQMSIKSPIDGQVLRVNKQAGEQTDENPLFVVVQTSKLEAAFFPPTQMFGKIKADQKVTLEIQTDPPTRREATIVAVDPIIDPASQLFRAKLEIDNSDGSIPAGTNVTWNWSAK